MAHPARAGKSADAESHGNRRATRTGQRWLAISCTA